MDIDPRGRNDRTLRIDSLRCSTDFTNFNNPSVFYGDVSLDRLGAGTIKNLATGNNHVMHCILDALYSR
jgi:hypothetical protein